MTICIAASCEKGNHIVVAVDRMFTAGPPLSMEFEPNISKIDQVYPGCVALAAGPTLFADEIYSKVKGAINTAGVPPVLQICRIVRDSYIAFRNEKVEEQIIQPMLAEDFQIFRAKGVSLPSYLQVQPMVYQQINVQASQFSLGLDLMLAGIDQTGCHIAVLSHPGTMVFLDKLGYGAIGSGTVHALVRLHLAGCDPSWSLHETIFAVYEAKLAAEVAPGVGNKTEMAVVSLGDTWRCPAPFLDELQSIHKAQMPTGRVGLDRIKEAYEQQRKASGSH